jgi:hypothetical protein
MAHINVGSSMKCFSVSNTLAYSGRAKISAFTIINSTGTGSYVTHKCRIKYEISFNVKHSSLFWKSKNFSLSYTKLQVLHSGWYIWHTQMQE